MTRAAIFVAAVMVCVSCGSSVVDTAEEAAPINQPTPQPSPTAEPRPTPPPEATTEGPDETGEQLFPDVLDVMLARESDGTYTVSATVSSPYDSAARYADAWRVLGPDGSVLGIRELLHDHAGEQPFTRSLGSVEIPDNIVEVTVEGRDQVSGWGGATVTVPVPSL